MWHRTACKNSVSQARFFFNLIKNEMIFFYRISELILATLIQRYDKKIISFLIQFKNEGLSGILQAVKCHILILYLYHISLNLLNLSWIKKNVYFL